MDKYSMSGYLSKMNGVQEQRCALLETRVHFGLLHLCREKEPTLKYLSRMSEKLDPLANQPSGTISVCSHWITRLLSSLRSAAQHTTAGWGHFHTSIALINNPKNKIYLASSFTADPCPCVNTSVLQRTLCSFHQAINYSYVTHTHCPILISTPQH